MSDKLKPLRVIERVPTLSTALVPRTSGLPVPIPRARPLADITADVRRLHAENMAGLSKMLANGIVIGDLLLEAKETVGHGNFEDYVTLECGISLSTSDVYRKLAKGKDVINQWLVANSRTSVTLSQAQALKILVSAQPKLKGAKKKSKSEPPAPAKPRKFWPW